MVTDINGFEKFSQLVRHPVKFRMFLFLKLPSAYFAGVRIRSINSQACETSVPYKWFSRNPFRSTYFACLSMAAELSTGALAMGHLYKKNPPVSMLVVKTEGEYFKKANGRARFRCEQGDEIRGLIEEAIQTGESRAVRCRSIGYNEAGEKVAEFYITWSFKTKQGK